MGAGRLFRTVPTVAESERPGPLTWNSRARLVPSTFDRPPVDLR
jgi:hypothetical protein